MGMFHRPALGCLWFSSRDGSEDTLVIPHGLPLPIRFSQRSVLQALDLTTQQQELPLEVRVSRGLPYSFMEAVVETHQ
jgi:hypothetical protein